MTKMHENRGQRGFTLTEMLTVTVILVALLALASIPIVKMQREVRQTELDSKAEIIFMAAQNRLTELKAAGQESAYRSGATPLGCRPIDADEDKYDENSLYYVRSEDKETEGSAASVILSRDKVDGAVWDSNWVVEFDPAGGSVYAVFYSEGQMDYTPDGTFGFLRDRERRLSDGAKVGYYGGDSVGAAPTGDLDPDIEIINGEQLLLRISCDMQGNYPLHFYVTLADEHKHSTGEIELTDNHGEIKQEYRTYTATMVIDDLTEGQAMRFSQQTRFKKHNLTPGDDLKITVRVSSESQLVESYTTTLKNRVNSLYNSVTKDEKGDRTAVITCGRHLQNLDGDSGISDGVKYAVQKGDIDFDSASDNSWSACYPGLDFKPILNEHLKGYESTTVVAEKEYHPVIYDLPVSAEGDAGLFESFGGDSLKYIRLAGAEISGSGAVGGIAGRITSQDAVIEGCQVFLSLARGHLGGKTEKDIWISGGTAGGLIGEIEAGASVTIKSSFASTVISGEDLSGGLVGHNAGDLSISKSYADSYLYGGQASGGLIGGRTGGSIAISECYTAGFLEAPVTAGICAGELGGRDSVSISYSACAPLDETGKLSYSTAAAASGSGPKTDRVYYIGTASEAAPLEGTEAVSYTDWSGENRGEAVRDKLNTSFTADNSDTYPYNLIEGMGLSSYSYPKLYGVPHYGDWQAEFESGSLVYYERYGSGTSAKYGFYGANVSTLMGMGDLSGDGYGMIYEGDVPSNVTVTDQNGRTVRLYATNAVTIENGEKTYYLLPLPSDMVNVTEVTGFYRRLTVDGREYFYNPHFASTAVSAERDIPDQISVRTARQLYALSTYYQAYTAYLPEGAAFLQGRAIDYGTYDWRSYGPGGASVSVQYPIGRSEAQPFEHTYNGGGFTIKGISFETEGSDLYAGMFGCVTGELRSIVLTTDKKMSDSGAPTASISTVVQSRTAYNGALAGLNRGSIYNCAVSGYRLEGHAFSISTFYIGGLVGYNDKTGTIRSSSVSCPDILASSTFATLRVGGLAGGSSGQIRRSYALASINIPEIREGDVVLAGLTPENRGTIRQSYCATALSSAGGTTYGFSPNSGSVSGCYYLNDGTYEFAGSIHLYDYKPGSSGAQPVSDSAMKTLGIDGFGRADAGHTYYYPNTAAEIGDAYPYPASVTGIGGANVHYGDWITKADMGDIGMVYWEYEAGGANAGYHFSFIGFGEDGRKEGSSLCEAHDDGGAIRQYGYGYYWMSSEPEATLTSSAENGVFRTGERQTDVERELAKQIPGFTFVAYRTAADGLRLDSYKDANGTWTLDQGGIKYSFTVCPFFADSYSYNSASGTAKEPGSDSLPYQVRSTEQLQFINWSFYNNTGSVSVDVTSANYRYFPYLQYTSSTSSATQTRSDAIRGDSTGGSRPIHTWKQTHDVNGTDLGALGDKTKNALIHPIAGAVAHTTSSSYDMVLYNWFGGKYDGQNYYIKNIRIDSYCYNVGLFGTTAGAELSNIVLYSDNGSEIQRNSDPTSWNYQSNGMPRDVKSYACSYTLGGLVGVAYDYKAELGSGRITNCAIAGYTIKDGSKNLLALGEATIGGLVGVANVSLDRCSAVADIEANSTHRWSDDSSLNSALWGNFVRIGGLVGGLRYNATNCYTGGSIKVDGELLKERIVAGDTTNQQFADGSTRVDIKWSNSRDEFAKEDGSKDKRKNQYPATYVYIGGIGGSGFSANFKNFSGGSGAADGTPYFENCYTYIDLPEMQGTICGISLIGSIADRYGRTTMTVRNCYYLDNIKNKLTFDKISKCVNPYPKRRSLADVLNTDAARDAMLYGDLTYLGRYTPDNANSNNFTINGVTGLTYDQMSNRIGGAGIQTQNGLNRRYDIFTDALGSAFSWVTLSEHGATVNGKYSFPGSDSALKGQNYPFPTVLTQRNIFGDTVSLHYGRWPKVGLFWSEGIVSLDMIADYDSQSQRSILKLELRPENTSLDPSDQPVFAYTNEGIVSAEYAWNANGGIDVTLVGLKVGATEVEASIGGYTARLMVTVTAEMNAAVEPASIEQYVDDDAAAVTMTAADKRGKAVPGVTWQIINSDTSTVSFTEPSAQDDGSYTLTVKGLAEGEATLQMIASCTLGGNTYEGVAVLPVTFYNRGVLGAANIATQEPYYYQGTMNKELTAWKTGNEPQQMTGLTDAPKPDNGSLFIYGRGAKAALGSFSIAGMTVTDSTGASYDVMQDNSVYSISVGEVSTIGSDSFRGLTVHGSRTGDLTIQMTLMSQSGGRFTLVMPYTLTQEDTEIDAVYLDADGKEVYRAKVGYGQTPGLPPAEVVAAMTPPEGYVFAGLDSPSGWQPSPDGAAYDDVTFTPVWRKASYTVTFKGIGMETSTLEVAPGEAVTWPASPARSGYRFMGWTIDGSQRYKDTDRYVLSSEVTFLAVWRKQVTITAYDTYDNVKMGEWTVADYDNGFTATFSYRWLVSSGEFELRMDSKTGIQYEFSRSTGWYGYTYTITIPADQFPQDEYETD